jgi:cell division protein FtsB
MRNVRWDRVTRWALLLVLAGVLALYVEPAINLWSTVNESEARQAEVDRLERANAELRERRKSLRSPATLEREARRLGMVRPGERAYVIENLPE